MVSKGLQRIFFEASPTYELVNHVMTWGLDILWRRKAAMVAAMDGGTRWIDICSGTGEMAAYLASRANGETTVIAADFSLPMMHKALAKPQAKRIAFILADAKSLPFPDETFDLVTTSFATRNLNVTRHILMQCFTEFHRVLKPGGRFISLETSQPPSRPIRRLLHLYVRLTVRPLGSVISGSRSAYAYLSQTIPRFYTADDLARILREAGFDKVSFQHMMFGAAAVHKATK